MGESVQEMPRFFSAGKPLAFSPEHFHAYASAWQAAAKNPPKLAPKSQRARGYSVKDKIATIELHGVMLSSPDDFLDEICEKYTVTSEFTDSVISAINDKSVKAILVRADTPGGEVAGLQAAHDAIASSTKPVVVSVSGLLCSAGVYALSAADEIIAENTAIIGSIGVMTTVSDFSKAYDAAGVKVHLVASGTQKGVGTMGVPVERSQLEPTQAIVDALAAQFRAAVSSGRKMPVEEVDKIATGAAWIASEAMRLGLVDKVATNPTASAVGILRKSMAITKETYKALIASYPDHRPLIDQLDSAEKDEGDIKAALVEASEKAHRSRINALESELAAVRENAAKDAEKLREEVAAEKAKAQAAENKLAQLNAHMPAHKDPGQGAGKNAAREATYDEFSAMTAKDRAAFMAAGGKII